jgi:hypothetical protein
MWNYKELPVSTIEDMPNNTIGFVYVITNRETGEWYIGKKSLYSTLTKPPLKGMKRKRKVTGESKWKEYQSSNKEVQKWVNVKKEILYYAQRKKELTYREVEAQFKLNVLEDKNCLNENISGKYFLRDIKWEIPE